MTLFGARSTLLGCQHYVWCSFCELDIKRSLCRNLMAPTATTAKKKNVQKVTTDFFADWDNDEPEPEEEEPEPSPVSQRREEEDTYVVTVAALRPSLTVTS